MDNKLKAILLIIVCWIGLAVLCLVLKSIINLVTIIRRKIELRRHTVLAQGICTRVEVDTSSDVRSVTVYFKVKTENDEGEFVLLDSVSHSCPIQKGDKMELLIDPYKSTCLLSENGLAKYKELDRKRTKKIKIIMMIIAIFGMGLILAMILTMGGIVK
jgi:hypothetical protein